MFEKEIEEYERIREDYQQKDVSLAHERLSKVR